MTSVHFQGKPFNITVIQIYAPTINTKEAEVDWFHEDLQDLLELTPKKDVRFITGDWNAKAEEIPRVTSKFGTEYKMKQDKDWHFCQENILVTANILFQQQKIALYVDITKIRLIIFFAAKDGEAL